MLAVFWPSTCYGEHHPFNGSASMVNSVCVCVCLNHNSQKVSQKVAAYNTTLYYYSFSKKLYSLILVYENLAFNIKIA